MTANLGLLAGKTVLITGSTRGIGKAIALKVASDKANVVIAAKTDKLHPKLPGTIHSVAAEVEAVGGRALACVCDVRSEEQIRATVQKTVATFGGIDVLINNASAISVTKVEDTDMKRFDLMYQINTRGTFLMTKECLPHLKKSQHAHVLNMTMPIDLNASVLANRLPYRIAKYGAALCVLGMAEEFREYAIAVNGLWPRTAIWTKAVEVFGGPEMFDRSRTPAIMADAAYAIISKKPTVMSGEIVIDEHVLREEGIKDFRKYLCNPNADESNLLFIIRDSERKVKL